MEQESNSSARILAVDDEPRNIRIVEELLEGYQLETAATGEECLEKLEDFVPDLILLDIMMPGIDGYEVCRRIKADKRFCSTKVLLVSGKAMIEERLQGYEAGADDYITKPFNLDELLAKVDVFLKLKTAEAVNAIKKDFLSILSHESRTPLNAVIGFSSLILDDKSMTLDEIYKSVGFIKESGESFLKLTDQILRLCALKESQRLTRSSTDVKKLVESSIESFLSQSKIAGAQFDIDMVDSELPVDRTLMKEAISCVLLEMIQSSEKENSQKESITLKGVQRGDKYVLEFCRDGGEWVEDVKDFFQEFTQAEVTHHTGIKHLNYSIARTICEMHGGTVGIEKTGESEGKIVMEIPA